MSAEINSSHLQRVQHFQQKPQHQQRKNHHKKPVVKYIEMKSTSHSEEEESNKTNSNSNSSSGSSDSNSSGSSGNHGNGKSSNNDLRYHNNTNLENDEKLKQDFIADGFEPEKNVCLICCNETTWHAVNENCEHIVCWKCCLGLRVLMKDNACCICKAKSDKVILNSRHPTAMKFQEYNLSRLYYDPQWNIYVDSKELMNAVDCLRSLSCPICNDYHIFKNMHQLKNHLSQYHKLYYCQLCLDHRSVFLGEQKLYTYKKLMEHYKLGEKDESGVIRGHPYCKFCKSRLYSDEEIFKHMAIEHLDCFICKRNGIMFEYYKDYDHLEQHFDQDHYMCKHPTCLQLKFVVFSNAVDLKMHEVKMHATSKAKKKELTRLDDILDMPSRGSQSADTSRRRAFDTITSDVIKFVGFPGNEVEQAVEEEKYSKERERESKRKGKQRMYGKSGELSKEFQYKAEPSPVSTSNSSQDEEIRQKNIELIRKMKEILNDDDKKFEYFKIVSSDFQKGSLLASEYYSILVKTFGSKSQELFSDLMATIPEKQQMKKDALNLAHSMYNSKEFGLSKREEDKKKEEEKQIQREEMQRQREEKQVLNNAKKQKQKPKQQVNTDFPSLPSNTTSQTKTWGPKTAKPKKEENSKPKKEDFPTLGTVPSINTVNTSWGSSLPPSAKGRSVVQQKKQQVARKQQERQQTHQSTAKMNKNFKK